MLPRRSWRSSTSTRNSLGSARCTCEATGIHLTAANTSAEEAKGSVCCRSETSVILVGQVLNSCAPCIFDTGRCDVLREPSPCQRQRHEHLPQLYVAWRPCGLWDGQHPAGPLVERFSAGCRAASSSWAGVVTSPVSLSRRPASTGLNPNRRIRREAALFAPLSSPQ